MRMSEIKQIKKRNHSDDQKGGNNHKERIFIFTEQYNPRDISQREGN